jgi:predicted SAM-dependent methyltransferase
MKNLIQRAKKFFSIHGIGRGKKMTLAQAAEYGVNLKRLHLGCGNIHIRDWCNVDVLKTGATDLVLDIESLPGIVNNSVEKIYSCHVLEHFSTKDIPIILARWHDVLEPGGEIRISVPDLDKITKIYQDNINHFLTPGNQPWIALIYGYHKTGFNYTYLKELLAAVGFSSIKEYGADAHFIEGVFDNSLAKEPFGKPISLNIVARKSI